MLSEPAVGVRSGTKESGEWFCEEQGERDYLKYPVPSVPALSGKGIDTTVRTEVAYL